MEEGKGGRKLGSWEEQLFKGMGKGKGKHELWYVQVRPGWGTRAGKA